ncbi:MAG: hypothetical protein EOM51_05505 [Clostridia bacterium]|nr:hypothetical protein [Clostridia bacterium]
MYGIISVCDSEILALSRDIGILLWIKHYYEEIGVEVKLEPVNAFDIEAEDEDGNTITLRLEIEGKLCNRSCG